MIKIGTFQAVLLENPLINKKYGEALSNLLTS